jgi:adenosylcobyric acid synthase
MKRPAALMMLGAGSDVGKSVLTAGLCRYFANQGLKVAPFKPQNMSNNAAVTADGGEIGRAQALQAAACRLPPSVHMNPVLLKPQSGTGSQIIVQGRMTGSAEARAYQAMKSTLMPRVLESFKQLCADADLVLVEGAGSAAEINLRAGDIANMGFAQAAKVPAIVIGDIDRGGVIASLVGMRHVLDAEDRSLINGFIVNKMRGDATLFDEGMRMIAAQSGWPSLGLVPWFAGAGDLPAEDSLGLAGSVRRGAALRIAALAYPRISNFDDLDALRAEPDIELVMVRPGEAIPGDCALVILPGSKSTIADLAALRATGWDIDLMAHRRRGGMILGLCGGYQMLGEALHDPDGIEGPSGSVSGLGLIDVETIMGGDKLLHETEGHSPFFGVAVRGYEMHIGRTAGPGAASPFALIDGGRPDGAISPDRRIIGTYLHGVFHDAAFRSAFLASFGAKSDGIDQHARVDAALDALAAHLARHIDMMKLAQIAGLRAAAAA